MNKPPVVDTEMCCLDVLSPPDMRREVHQQIGLTLSAAESHITQGHTLQWQPVSVTGAAEGIEACTFLPDTGQP